jgi:hypothetical protein
VLDQNLTNVLTVTLLVSYTKENVSSHAQMEHSQMSKLENVNLVTLHAKPVHVEDQNAVLLAKKANSYTKENV